MLYTKICLPNIFFLVPLFPDIRILDVVGFDFADCDDEEEDADVPSIKPSEDPFIEW